MSLQSEIHLITVEELLNLPPVSWLMDGLIPENGFVGIYGAPGNGKSFVALDWAIHIALGRPWLGRFPTKQSPVIYIAAEGGRGIQKRVKAWMDYHNIVDVPGLYFLLTPLYVREAGVVDEFLAELEDRDIFPGLVVLDTLSRSFGGGEENASADMGQFVEEVARLAAGRQMSALVVHHKNAAGARERGSTVFRGALDAMFHCDATKENGQAGKIQILTLTNDKQKDDVEAEPIYIKPVDTVGESLVFELTSPPMTAGQERAKKEAFMRTADMLSVLGVAEKGLTASEWRLAAGGIPERTFWRRLRRLKEASAVYYDAEVNRYFVMATTKDLAGLDDE